jgi:hypothetical protein
MASVEIPAAVKAVKVALTATAPVSLASVALGRVTCTVRTIYNRKTDKEIDN